jgi:hypothetical protein
MRWVRRKSFQHPRSSFLTGQGVGLPNDRERLLLPVEWAWSPLPLGGEVRRRLGGAKKAISPAFFCGPARFFCGPLCWRSGIFDFSGLSAA